MRLEYRAARVRVHVLLFGHEVVIGRRLQSVEGLGMSRVFSMSKFWIPTQQLPTIASITIIITMPARRERRFFFGQSHRVPQLYHLRAVYHPRQNGVVCWCTSQRRQAVW